MKNIVDKISSHRSASASVCLHFPKSILEQLKKSGAQVQKGNIFEIAKIAGMMGAKNPATIIPHCHQLGLEDFTLTHSYIEDEKNQTFGIKLTVFAQAVHKTGVEIEALVGVNIAALTIYDLLKIKTKIQIIHNKIANTRKDYLHKVSDDICKNHAVIYIENL